MMSKDAIPVVWCRVYCQQLRPHLEAVLAQQLPANRAFFDLLEATHQLERHALRWCSSVLGALSPDAPQIPTGLPVKHGMACRPADY